MYKLESGNKNNIKHLLFLESDPEAKALIKKHHTQYNVMDMIFQEKIDADTCDDIISALSIGDELSVPISEQAARYLFFALCINITHQKVRIKTISKAGMLYSEYNGDYSKAIFVDQENSIAYLATIHYNSLVPNNRGKIIQYQIPLYTWIGPDKQHIFTIAEQDWYFVLVNDQKTLISRKSMLDLIGMAFSLQFKNHDEILNMIDTSDEILAEVLNDADFRKLTIDYPFDNEPEFTDDLRLLAWEEPIENINEDWDILNKGKYLFNKKYENIVPFKPNNYQMTIYYM